MLTIGLEGVSRSAFVADALLLSIAALGWRGALGAARPRARARVGQRAGAAMTATWSIAPRR